MVGVGVGVRARARARVRVRARARARARARPIDTTAACFALRSALRHAFARGVFLTVYICPSNR